MLNDVDPAQVNPTWYARMNTRVQYTEIILQARRKKHADKQMRCRLSVSNKETQEDSVGTGIQRRIAFLFSSRMDLGGVET